jgi:predicted DNA-binding transcriptional regulator AlpA
MSKEVAQEVMTAKDLCQLLQISVVSLRRRRKEEGFPKPFGLGRSIRWLRSDIDKWLKSITEKS